MFYMLFGIQSHLKHLADTPCDNSTITSLVCTINHLTTVNRKEIGLHTSKQETFRCLDSSKFHASMHNNLLVYNKLFSTFIINYIFP